MANTGSSTTTSTITSATEAASTELSARRTGMSFQRTRMSADRTLMSVIRTSLSLIGFGFTIFQFFQKLREAGTLTHSEAPRNFGVTLVGLGIVLLVAGLVYQLRFMTSLRAMREHMQADGLIIGESEFPVSFTMIVAVLLLLLGVTAILSMTIEIGPFS